jgi:ribose-phosphate pyrophosphokinase
MKAYIIPTFAVSHLIGNLEKEKNFEIVFPSLNREGKRYFPDGEIYMKILKIKKLKGKRVVVLHSGAPKPNEGIVELELILQILKDNKIEPEVFFTYFPYGMQDKVFEKGETNVAENLIEKLINYYKVKKIYLIDPHFEGRKWVKKYPIVSVSAIPILMERAKRDFGKEILFLATDPGGRRRFKIPGFDKVRKNSYTVELRVPEKLKKMIRGKIVGIVDDVLKTGTTLLKVYEQCKKYGAKEVVCLVSHGVLREGILKVKRKYSRVYLTNSINQAKGIDITNLILKMLHD